MNNSMIVFAAGMAAMTCMAATDSLKAKAGYFALFLAIFIPIVI